MSYLQYTPIVGPLTGPDPYETQGWDHTSYQIPVRRPWPVATLVASEAATPLILPTQPYETYGWNRTPQDTAAARMLSRHAALVSIVTTQDLNIFLAPPVTNGYGGTSSWIATGSSPILQFQSLASVFYDTPAPPPEGAGALRFAAYLTPKRSLHPSRQPSWFSDKFTAPTAAVVPDHSWQGRYPAQIEPRRSLGHALQKFFATDTVQVPGAAPAPFESWTPRYPARHSYNRPLAPYVWGEQHFAYVTQVPVMSWTGLYLDPPVQRPSYRALTASGQPHLLVHSLVADAAPDLSWQPRYPSKVDPKQWARATFDGKYFGPEFVADTTIAAPDLSWNPTFADFARIAQRVLAGAQPALFMDARWVAPDVVTAPALAAPVYVDYIFRRMPPAERQAYVQPIYITDITDPAPPVSWLPHVPDYINRARMPVAQQQAHSEPIFVQGVTVIAPTQSWQGYYPSYIWRRPRLATASQPTFTIDAKWDAPPLVLGIHIDGTVYLFRSLDGNVFVVRRILGDVKVD